MPWASRVATMFAGTPRSAKVPSKAGVGVAGCGLLDLTTSGSRSVSRSRGGRTLVMCGAGRVVRPVGPLGVRAVAGLLSS